jgi:hypothetical protein
VTSHMIGSMVPNQANVFVDDCARVGPHSDYNQDTIPENNEICQFIFEFATTLQELLACIKESGVTITGQKMVIETLQLALLGAIVSKDGAQVSHEINAKLSKWLSCRNSTDV